MSDSLRPPVSTQYHAISHSVVRCCSQPAVSMGLTSMADYLLYPAILYKELNSSGYQNPWILKDDCIFLLLILLINKYYLFMFSGLHLSSISIKIPWLDQKLSNKSFTKCLWILDNNKAPPDLIQYFYWLLQTKSKSFHRALEFKGTLN